MTVKVAGDALGAGRLKYQEEQDFGQMELVASDSVPGWRGIQIVHPGKIIFVLWRRRARKNVERRAHC